MQREFVIVYKAKHPENNVRNMFMSGYSPKLQVVSDPEFAGYFCNLGFLKELLEQSPYKVLDSLHEPGVVMEKITTISLKPVD